MCGKFYENLSKIYYFKKQYDKNPDTTSPLQVLNSEEAKLFILLQEGFSVSECAKRLNKKRSDVKKDRGVIFRKLAVGSITELIVKYGKNKI